jgi:2-polyprenyl-3-methyl-5-hydroxy-6-metoxy-1,4-benzoquinol methylase
MYALIQHTTGQSSAVDAHCQELVDSLKNLKIIANVVSPQGISSYLQKAPSGPVLWFKSALVRFTKPVEILDFMKLEKIKVFKIKENILGFEPKSVIHQNGDLVCTDRFFFAADNIETWDSSGLQFTGERVVPTSLAAQPYIKAHMDVYKKFFPYAKAGRILDAACGCGYGTAELAKLAGTVVGVDISQEAVDYAQSYYPLPNLTFLRTSVVDLPFQNNSFNVVTSVETFEHVEPISAFINEVKRVLVPGGHWLFSTPNGDVHKYKPKTLEERRGHHVWHYDVAELKNLLTGFKVGIEESDFNPERNNYNSLVAHCVKL